MEYTVIQAYDFNFEREVNDKIKEGWEPIGGVGAVKVDSEDPLTGELRKYTTLYQAMTKK